MSTSTNGTHSRPTLAYGFRGVGAREETLFKSFVRLLDHVTEQGWVYREADVDLLVVAGDADHASAPIQLRLGTDCVDEPHALRLPIHAQVLEARLNALGAEVLRTRAQEPVPAAPAPSPEAAPGPRLRLTRWPPASMMSSPAYYRLAAVMGAAPLRLVDIAARSGVPEATCLEFARRAMAAGLLERVDGPPPRANAQRSPVHQPGLLARIRHRLGLSGRTQA